MENQPEVIHTDDGSTSLYISQLDETYHSRKGAVAESKHVFIEQGLQFAASNRKEIDVFEVGFGTGLNALLTLKATAQHDLRVNYFTVEKYPLLEKWLSEMNYGDEMGGEFAEQFEKLHDAAWENWTVIHPHFRIFKHKTDIDQVDLIEEFDVVYYDAFGPRVQPNMWTTEKLAVVHRLLRKNGILVTYCAQGQFKRNLKTLGFEVERLPGPPGKREMTRGTKI